MLREEKGITLVALIITIIVLIILAAVTIIAVQDSDLIARTQNATIIYAANQVYENSVVGNMDKKVSYVDSIVRSVNAGGGGD